MRAHVGALPRWKRGDQSSLQKRTTIHSFITLLSRQKVDATLSFCWTGKTMSSVLLFIVLLKAFASGTLQD